MAGGQGRRAVTSPLTGIEATGTDWRVVRGAGRRIVGPVVGGGLGTIRALVGTPWAAPGRGGTDWLAGIASPRTDSAEAIGAPGSPAAGVTGIYPVD